MMAEKRRAFLFLKSHSCQELLLLFLFLYGLYCLGFMFAVNAKKTNQFSFSIRIYFRIPKANSNTRNHTATLNIQKHMFLVL